jgi:hypothetical protein
MLHHARRQLTTCSKGRYPAQAMLAARPHREFASGTQMQEASSTKVHAQCQTRAAPRTRTNSGTKSFLPHENLALRTQRLARMKGVRELPSERSLRSSASYSAARAALAAPCPATRCPATTDTTASVCCAVCCKGHPARPSAHTLPTPLARPRQQGRRDSKSHQAVKSPHPNMLRH